MSNANSLYASRGTGEWKQDGSSGNKVEIGETEISIASKSEGTPFNLMFETSEDQSTVPVSRNYFEVKVLQGNLSIGWVTKEEFQPGWKCKGMFYNGNVTNASAALIVGFGEYTKKGMTVGTLLETDESSCSVYFYVNGSCLGCAFQLKKKEDINVRRFPCLDVSGKAKVEWKFPEIVPSQRQREQPSYPNEPFKGDWELTKLDIDGANVKLPCKIVASLDRKTPLDSVLNFSIRVGNTLRTSITLGSNTNERTYKVSIGPIASTRMMPPPDVYAAEQKVGNVVPKITEMSTETCDDGSSRMLIMRGTGVELLFKPYHKTFNPLNDYHHTSAI